VKVERSVGEVVVVEISEAERGRWLAVGDGRREEGREEERKERGRLESR